MGSPSTAQRRGSATASGVLAAPLLQQLGVGGVLGAGAREPGLTGVQVDCHEEAVSLVGGLEDGLHRCLARGGDRTRRKTSLLVGVVGRVGFPCLRGGVDREWKSTRLNSSHSCAYR